MNPMDATFKFQLAVSAFTLNKKDDFLITSDISRVIAKQFCLQTFSFSEAGLHHEQVTGKAASSSGAASNLHDRFFVRIFRQEEKLQLVFS